VQVSNPESQVLQALTLLIIGALNTKRTLSTLCMPSFSMLVQVYFKVQIAQEICGIPLLQFLRVHFGLIYQQSCFISYCSLFLHVLAAEMH
jgi:hypothetical protein